VSDDPCRRLESVGADGARLAGCAHGGHVTGWWPAGAARSRLWMSDRSECGPGIAIRGGIPVIFPQFGTLGPLRKHGYARDVAWTRTPVPRPDDQAEAVLVFETSMGPIDDWPHQARLVLTATALGDSLTLVLRVHNTGGRALQFTAALHSYLAVEGADAQVVGLAGHTARDAMVGGRQTTLAERIPTAQAMDLMVEGVPDVPVEVHEASGGSLALTAYGFGDRVLWNPGPRHTLADVAPGDERGFVCVEPAVLEPVDLPPQAWWEGGMRLTARPDDSTLLQPAHEVGQ
jgi:glucose-6-phosphate 1-epimerase